MGRYLQTRHYAGYDIYVPGNAFFICDRCSQRFRRSAMLTEWTGLKVDAKCLDPRPPQQEPPDVYPEGIPFPDARPPQDLPDRLEDDTALQSVVGGFMVTPGVTYPDGQHQTPGSISPLPITENIPTESGIALATETGLLLTTDDGEIIDTTLIDTPFGPDVLADDVTFITGPVAAPSND